MEHKVQEIMSSHGSKIEGLNMKPSSNGGLIISYSEAYKNGGGSFDNVSYRYKDESFSKGDDKKAFARFCELKCEMCKEEEEED
jgi:hypothetical protein